jgi:Dolichyl-phosphate-mannose-protein mannosyltransferase
MGEHRRFFLGTTLAGLALRLFFFVYFPAVTDDSRIYADLATNWLQHGIYGQTQGTQIVPTDTRLPGYPLFLVKIFWVFGIGNFKAVLLTQILLDLGTCLIVADLARRMVSERAARIAYVLAALCPFLANYAAAVLTETLEIFFTAAALDCAAAALDRMEEGASVDRLWAATGAAIAACILLRPDGGILLAGVVLYLTLRLLTSAAKADSGNKPAIAAVNRCATQKPVSFRKRLVAGIIVAAVALAPLVPWTVRNFRTLHQFQPLAPRYATESDELVPRGFICWVKTWIVDYASVEEIYWNVPGVQVDPTRLPARAFDTAAERDATLAVFVDYNQTQVMTPALDGRLGEIAADRIRAHPVRYYAVLPLLRAADMWLRPRTELLPPDVRWWEFNDDPKYLTLAVGFGLLNLAYVGAALWALFRRASGIRWAGLLVSFLLLRSALLLTLENPEPRYTLECYPAVIVLAAATVTKSRSASH